MVFQLFVFRPFIFRKEIINAIGTKLSTVLFFSSLSLMFNTPLYASGFSLSDFDGEVLIRAFSFVDNFRDNRNLAFVSKQFNHLANAPLVLKNIKFTSQEVEAYQKQDESKKKSPLASVIENYAILATIEEQINAGAFQKLAPELIFSILNYESPQELFLLSQTCRLLNRACHDFSIWKLGTIVQERRNAGAFQKLPLKLIVSLLSNNRPQELFLLSQTCRLLNRACHDARLWEDVTPSLRVSHIGVNIFPIRNLRLEREFLMDPVTSQMIEKAFDILSLSLKNLNFCCNISQWMAETYSNLYFKAFSRLPNLVVLDLGNPFGLPKNITDTNISYLFKCPQLKELHLFSLTKVTKPGLGALASLKTLERLELKYMRQFLPGDIPDLLPQLKSWRINDKNYEPISRKRKYSKLKENG